MNLVTYIVEGRETTKCWQDDANMRVVHGPATVLGEGIDFHDVAALATSWFTQKNIKPGNTDLFVTIRHVGADNEYLDYEILTARNYGEASDLTIKEAIGEIVRELIFNGTCMGVSEPKFSFGNNEIDNPAIGFVKFRFRNYDFTIEDGSDQIQSDDPWKLPYITNRYDKILLSEVDRLTTLLAACLESNGFFERFQAVQGDPNKYLKRLCGIKETIVKLGKFGVEDGPGIQEFGKFAQRVAHAFASFAYSRTQFFKNAGAFETFENGPGDPHSVLNDFRAVANGYQRPCGTVNFYCTGKIIAFDIYVLFESKNIRYLLCDTDDHEDVASIGKRLCSMTTDERRPYAPAILLYTFDKNGKQGQGTLHHSNMIVDLDEKQDENPREFDPENFWGNHTKAFTKTQIMDLA
jgi:hypothetical protein